MSFPMKPSEVVSYGVVEALDNVCFFLGLYVLLLWKKLLVALPVVSAVSVALDCLYFRKELLSRGLPTTTTLEGKGLSSVSIKSKPHPELRRFF